MSFRAGEYRHELALSYPPAAGEEMFKRGRSTSHGWKTTKFADVNHVLEVLTELRGRRWVCRGQSEPFGCLQPSIDRAPRQGLSRIEKLKLERQSIDLFRSTARFFAGEGEAEAMQRDVVALMVMRHYGVPTRLLDWSLSPFVAAGFTCLDSNLDGRAGELWTLDYDRYLEKGTEQWQRWPNTTRDGKGTPELFDEERTAFTVSEPHNWFVLGFYGSRRFPRQNAQNGLYSMTARFGRNHDAAIADLMGGATFHHLYVIPPALKPELRRQLRELHGVWRGSLFPDSAGAAETAGKIFATKPK